MYRAQTIKSEPNDWYQQIIKDKQDLQITLSDSQITSLSKTKYKSYISMKVLNEARRNLDERRKAHSKSAFLKTFQPKPQEYLNSTKLDTHEKQLLMKLRTHMLIEAKVNFKTFCGEQIWCSICHLFPESQKHIYECLVIRKEAERRNLKLSDQISYESIDGSLEEQEKFVHNYTLLLVTRQQILESRDKSPQAENHSTEDSDSLDDLDTLDAAVNLN